MKVEEVSKKFNHDGYISKLCIMQTPWKPMCTESKENVNFVGCDFAFAVWKTKYVVCMWIVECGCF